MLKLPEQRINLDYLVNPFYLYPLSFILSILLYLWGWSSIYPSLPGNLLIFFSISFALFILVGKSIIRIADIIKGMVNTGNYQYNYLNDLFFTVIMALGFINILFMGYLPVLDRSHDYRDFGVPILDPLFNSLSIFFAVFFFQSFLTNRKVRLLIYVLLIIIIQLLIFRRSAVIWISVSSVFLYILYMKRMRFIILAGFFCLIPLFSYSFGLYGNMRSNLNREYVLNDLGASGSFMRTGLNHNHYMTYLYVSSPLANLNVNLEKGEGFFNNKEFKRFIFYCIVPQSITLRLEKLMIVSPPETCLIHPHLLAGTFLMTGFYTTGWFGMISMVILLFFFISLCCKIIERFNLFGPASYSLLCTTVFLLIFSNFLNRMDVVLMLFIYPVFFHFIYERYGRSVSTAN